ncbi:Non-hemolytic phospholipase C [Pararobbsia alpina]|uniref:phosphocholine-specific phospholipase C n=1 Tax=Pararobbsia alpina TaxID=621374 RepID=UPI0039A5D20E
MSSKFDRRRFLKTTASSAGAAAALTVMPESIRRALAIPANNKTGTIRDVEHIVVFMQENRSFDHYYGHLRGVRGYNDRLPITLPNGNPVWFQPSKESATTPVLPFRLNTQTTSAMCVGDLDHNWYPTHYAINGGKYDSWPANKTDMTMGYYVRDDIPFHYALADAFTICDNYFCSLPGPTHPNRMYLMTGWVDSTGQYGGPLLDNNDPVDGDNPPNWGALTWETYPERLQKAGISWQVYQQGVNGNDATNGNYGTNMLPNFTQFINAAADSPLTLRGNSVRTLVQLKQDVMDNKLPQVSWICPPAIYSEHPKYTPAYGAEWTSQILDALTSNPEVWSKTVLFIMYDENDGFFDHVVPPQPPLSSTQGASTVAYQDEIHTVVNPLRQGKYTDDGLPYGLGPRVPMTVVSPWSKGGFVNSQVFDHTSVIRFIEARFGVNEPNISNWRRTVTGDLLSTFDFRTPDVSFPTLPDTSGYIAASQASCLLPAPTVPATPSTSTIEAQEAGIRRARPIPYELHANGHENDNKQEFVIHLANTGDQGAHFYIYSTNRTDGPWSYTVGAGKSLKAEFDVSSTNGTYNFTVHGPNGFFREFNGTIDANTDKRQKTAQPELKVGYDVANGNLYLTLTNKGRASVKLSVVDNAYGAAARHFSLPSEGYLEAPWQLQTSYHWYDLTVTDGNGFSRRVAGHVENGKASYSDPAATAPVTTAVASAEVAPQATQLV